MSKITGLAYMLNLSFEQIIVIMKKLDIPVDSPDYIVTAKDVKKIKKYVRKNNGSLIKDTFVAAVTVLSIYFMFTTIGSSIVSPFNNEASVPTTSIFINERYPVQSGIVNYYLLSNECKPVSYSDKDFLVVENIKVFLSNEGYYTGTIDEVFGTQLVNSVKDFQKDMGIRIDGVVGPTTHKMMQNYDSCSKTSKVTLISCYGGDYKAYLECTSPYGTTGVETSNTSSQDTEPPKWDSDSLQLTRVNGTFLDILWGQVTDNNGIDKLHLYIDGELHSSVDGSGCTSSCSSTTSETRFKVINLSVDTSYVFEVVACDSSGNCSKNNPTTAQILVDKPPVWDEANPPVVDNLGERFDLSIPNGSVIDDLGVVSYEVYVNGVLASYTKISDSYFSVLPAFDTTCGEQIVYVVAYDTAGQSSQSTPVTFERSACSAVVTTTTTTLPGTPTVTITASQVSDGDTSADSSITLTFITSASTTNFAAGDVTVSGGTLSNFSGSGTTYTATFTPSAVGATTIDVAANTFTNAATGVNNVAATQFNWTYSTAPTMTITAAEVNDGDTSNDTSLSVTFTASQSTTNFAIGDVVVGGGTLSNFSGSGTTYTATFTPSAEGATTIDVAANSFTNAFSTNNTAATQFNWTYAVSVKLANCGNSSTNANRWVVAVIDEDDSQGITQMTSQWTNFRNQYPDRCFHLLEPHKNYGFTRTTPNGLDSSIYIPTAFLNEFSAGTTFHARVSRNSGGTVSGTSDWWDLIGASVLPSGAKIGLCIDNSGSMTVTTVQASLDLFEQKAAAAGVTITPGFGANNTSYYCNGMSAEEWISGLKVDIN